jgi:hypothetical protein
MMKFSRAFISPLLPRRILAACVCAAILSASGCAGNASNSGNTGNAGNAGSTASKTNSQGNAAVAGSTPGAPWNEALQKWWQALSQPGASPKTQSAKQNRSAAPNQSAAPKTSAPSQAEIAAIAARHPAWKLAEALEKNRVQPLQFEAIAGRSPVAGSTPAAPSFDVRFPAATDAFATNAENRNLPAPAWGAVASNETENREPESGADDFVAPVVIAPDMQELREAARARQENSIAEFLRAARTRQADWQRDYRVVLETALGEKIEVAQQRAPSSVALVLPSPELQLEMTNLRLQLLSNVFSTPGEREKASARLQELMKLWRAALAKQEKIRADELERLRVEEPARLRQIGLTQLEEQLETIRRAQQANRDAIAAEHRARLEADFGDENARLAITLPPLGAPGVLPPPGATSFSSATSQSNPAFERIIFPRTYAPQRASVSAFSGVAASQTQIATARAAQIRALRALAWHDAKRQAKMAQRLKN